jgi:hypothetical protein
MIPLIEVVPGKRTDPQAVEDAKQFYAAIGKGPIVIEIEVPGFVANRLQSALFRESIYLVSQGVKSKIDTDSENASPGPVYEPGSAIGEKNQLFLVEGMIFNESVHFFSKASLTALLGEVLGVGDHTWFSLPGPGNPGL